MYVVYRYPVKPTWLKAMKASNLHGWSLLNVRNVKKYYSETVEMTKGHMNHIRKNICSIKEKQAKFKSTDTAKLKSKKERDTSRCRTHVK